MAFAADPGCLADVPSLRLWRRAADVDDSGADDDALSLIWARPLRVTAARFDFNLPVAYRYDSETATFARRASSLVPRGREQTVEAAYGLALGRAELGANLAWRRQADNRALAPDQLIGAATLHWAW